MASQSALQQRKTTTSSPEHQESDSDAVKLTDFLLTNPDVEFIWLQCIDYTATVRSRIIPVEAFESAVQDRKYPSITSGLQQILQIDAIAEGGSATGQFQLQPDLNTLILNRGIDAVVHSASCQTFWLQDGTASPVDGCPRSTLGRIVEVARKEFGITFLMGFEIEICYVRAVKDDNNDGPKGKSYEPVSAVHGWNGLTTDQVTVLPMIEDTVRALKAVGIKVPMFHAEAAPGQWEFVLPPGHPLAAVDMLFKARQTITFVALKHGLKATI